MVDEPHVLGSDPGRPDLLVVIVSVPAGEQPLPGVFGEVFRVAAQHAPDPVERVVAVGALAVVEWLVVCVAPMVLGGLWSLASARLAPKTSRTP